MLKLEIKKIFEFDYIFISFYREDCTPQIGLDVCYTEVKFEETVFVYRNL